MQEHLGPIPANATFHYDLGNEFYALWLGRDLVYSCAYFHGDNEDIDTAQSRKLDYLCRKLLLRPGETLLDVGCGWGALVIHAARNYGVRAVGITVSPEQKKEAERRIALSGLSDHALVELRDYRELPAERVFDKVASVGMLEHVGKPCYDVYMRTLARSVRPGGLVLVQTIGSILGSAPNPWIARNIFPGIYLPALGEVTMAAAGHDLAALDVESLRMHYHLTMSRWSKSFDTCADTIAAKYGTPFVRKWRLYLRGCAAAFRYGKLDVWQICFAKSVSNDLPLTRSHLYSATSSGDGIRDSRSVSFTGLPV